MSRGLSPTLFICIGGGTMANKNNAYCAICGNPYYVCMSCLDSMRLSPWKIHTDTSEHFKVYQIVHGFTSNVYNKDEAKTKLKNVDLQDMESFRPHIKEIIKDILKEEEPIAKSIEAEVEIAKVENNTVVDNVEDIVEVEVEETEIVEDVVKPTVSRKKNYKVEAE